MPPFSDVRIGWTVIVGFTGRLWAWTGTTWRQLSFGGGPQADAAAVYDPRWATWSSSGPRPAPRAHRPDLAIDWNPMHHLPLATRRRRPEWCGAPAAIRPPCNTAGDRAERLHCTDHRNSAVTVSEDSADKTAISPRVPNRCGCRYGRPAAGALRLLAREFGLLGSVGTPARGLPGRAGVMAG